MTTTTDQQPGSRDPRDREPRAGKHDSGRGISEPEPDTTPEAVQAARVARRDRAAGTKRTESARGVRGVEWVRPTDLLARHSARAAGRGIDFEAELARRARRLTSHVTRVGGPRTGRLGRAASARARRLPDVSEFGRGDRPGSWVTRSGIGLG